MPSVSPTALAGMLTAKLPHKPTAGQDQLIRLLSDFLLSKKPNRAFILKGYAGTGKTTVVGALTSVLDELKHSYALLAPTGRAAKVLAAYSGRPAYTLHKALYRTSGEEDSNPRAYLRENRNKNMIFIVDEASMIAGESSAEPGIFGGNNLLDDLMSFVYSGENCCLILTGDPAQLPPVGTGLSPALDPECLKTAYHLSLSGYELVEVVRQDSESGILNNATRLRRQMDEEPGSFRFSDIGSDVVRINGSELEDCLNTAYSSDGGQDCIVICRSNRRANLFNNEIRRRILWREGTINGGDRLMVVKNNYFWLSKKSKSGFIANGDTLEVLRIKRTEEPYEGFVFADATVRLSDEPGEKDLEVKLLLNTLDAEGPALPRNEWRRLYQCIQQEYTDIPDRNLRLRKVFLNPYLNALEVKFAYALTCHKTQGGQWKNVFVEQGYLTREMIDRNYLRWLYTAVTRATGKLYLVNFGEQFF